jgi:hypothetical protein
MQSDRLRIAGTDLNRRGGLGCRMTAIGINPVRPVLAALGRTSRGAADPRARAGSGHELTSPRFVVAI